MTDIFQIVLRIHRRGEYPSEAKVKAELGGPSRAHLGMKDEAARKEAMQKLGIPVSTLGASFHNRAKRKEF